MDYCPENVGRKSCRPSSVKGKISINQSNMAKIGDTVRFLNSVGGGRIVRIERNMAYVEDGDGFEVPALLKECVVVMDNATEQKSKAKQTPTFGQAAPSPSAPKSKEIATEPELPVIETPDGDRLNIVLGFLADDLKKLSSTGYTAELVNDSNYYIAFSLSARGEDDGKWHLLRAATVEPNIVLSVCSLSGADIQRMDRVALQYITFKHDKDFEMKRPASVEHKLDTTKFFKLHCFKDNIYFDEPVIALDIVRDDRPYSPMHINGDDLERAMKEKRQAERPAVRPVRRNPAKRHEIIEVDLHIGELTDSIKGLSSADMLNMQIDEFRRVMDANLKNHGQKIVFIHGKGEGVLRQALIKELNHRYKGHDVQDASFREYGFGATQVTIR